MEESTKDARVLVLDERGEESPLGKALRGAGYEEVHVSDDVDSCAKLCEELEPELVVIDLVGPDFKGVDAVRTIRGPAILVLAGPDDVVARRTSLSLGARDFISKPLDLDEANVRIGNTLENERLRREVGVRASAGVQDVRKWTTELWDSLMQLEETRKDLSRSRAETVRRLSIAATYREDETPGHIERMSRYCALLAQADGADSETIETILYASRLHDIGKIGVSDLILLKQGILTPGERKVMEQHVPIGVRVLEGSDSPVIQMGAVIAGSHHERYDGTGYPKGIAGEDIPVEGRIAAIADVFDALTHNRTHRRAFALGNVLDMLNAESGTHFDPRLLDLFLGALDTVLTIYEEHRESA